MGTIHVESSLVARRSQSLRATPLRTPSPKVLPTTPTVAPRQYSVSGLDDDESYDIFLFPSADVSEDDDGVVSFEDDDENNEAGDSGHTGSLTRMTPTTTPATRR